MLYDVLDDVGFCEYFLGTFEYYLKALMNFRGINEKILNTF